MRRLSPLLLAAILACSVSGCATATAEVSDRLFFGLAIPGGGEITEAQWDAFVAEVIVPRFPDGFTVWRGAGHWKGNDGVIVTEQSRVFEIVHARSAADDVKLEEIAQLYRKRFNQEAVMGVRTPAGMTFWRR